MKSEQSNNKLNTFKAWAKTECNCQVRGNKFYFDSSNYVNSPLFREVAIAQGFTFKENNKKGQLIYTFR